MFLHFVRFFAWLPLWILFPTIIYGRKNLPKGKAILTPNHISNGDIVLLVANTFEKRYVLAKKELFENKVMGAVLKSFGGISIDRNNVDLNAMKKTFKVLKEDKKLIIFPEGTRNKGDINQLGEIKNGTGMIATKTQTSIVPVWISKRAKFFRVTKIYFGKPYQLDEFYGKKLSDEDNERIKQIIKNKILELKK